MTERPILFSPQPGSRGMNEIQFAAYCGDVEGVRKHLADGAECNSSDDFGYSPLHWNARMACAPGERVEVIDLLVSAGGDVNQRDAEGNTVLDSALEATASDAMIEHLKSYGAI